MKIILIKTSARTQLPQPATLSEAGEPASASGHQTRRQLGDSRAVKTTPVNASLARSSSCRVGPWVFFLLCFCDTFAGFTMSASFAMCLLRPLWWVETRQKSSTKGTVFAARYGARTEDSVACQSAEYDIMESQAGTQELHRVQIRRIRRARDLTRTVSATNLGS